jgi:hypothetical protein
MLDSTPEEIIKQHGCLVKLGRVFILTTMVGVVLSIWEWFDGRIVALTFFSLLILIVICSRDF